MELKKLHGAYEEQGFLVKLYSKYDDDEDFWAEIWSFCPTPGQMVLALKTHDKGVIARTIRIVKTLGALRRS